MPGGPIQPTDPRFRKIVVLLAAPSGAGKTTLANVLRSDNIHYIYLDVLVSTIPSWCTLKTCNMYWKTFQPPGTKIDRISKEIDRTSSKEFVAELIEKHCVTEKPIILIEGYTAHLPNIRSALLAKLKEKNHIIWSLQRG